MITKRIIKNKRKYAPGVCLIFDDNGSVGLGYNYHLTYGIDQNWIATWSVTSASDPTERNALIAAGHEMANHTNTSTPPGYRYFDLNTPETYWNNYVLPLDNEQVFNQCFVTPNGIDRESYNEYILYKGKKLIRDTYNEIKPKYFSYHQRKVAAWELDIRGGLLISDWQAIFEQAKKDNSIAITMGHQIVTASPVNLQILDTYLKEIIDLINQMGLKMYTMSQTYDIAKSNKEL